MSRFSKFRRAPVRFFRDAENPIVRALGPPLGALVERIPLLLEALESPHDLVQRRAQRPWGQPFRKLLASEAARRYAVLKQHGHPLVSIIVPAHNAESTIAPALESLQSQTYTNLEIIVIDDHSSDRTRELLQAMTLHSPSLRLLTNHGPAGAAATRNVGLDYCSGEYITFMDADDKSHPERIERQLYALLEEPTAILCTCNYVRHLPDGTRVAVNDYRFQRSIISMMFHRRHLQQAGTMPLLVVGEDSEFYQRLVGANRNHVRHIDKTMYFAQYRPDSLLFSHQPAQVRVLEP